MAKELTLFYMHGCPYCRQAERAIQELTEQNEQYRSVKLNLVDEEQSPEIVEQYDYYYVPAIFMDKEKLYEAHPGESYEECKAHVKEAFNKVL